MDQERWFIKPFFLSNRTREINGGNLEMTKTWKSEFVTVDNNNNFDKMKSDRNLLRMDILPGTYIGIIQKVRDQIFSASRHAAYKRPGV